MADHGTAGRESGGRARTRDEVKGVIEQALRAAFPRDTVDVSDGYGSNIHVVVVSRVFEPMTDRQCHEHLWGLIAASGLTDAELGLVSLVVGTSPSLLK